MSTAELTMTQAAEDFVQRFEAAWAGRDPDVLVGLLDEDVRALYPGMEAEGGRDELHAWLHAAFAGMPDLQVRLLGWASSGDNVHIEWEAAATVAGERLAWRGADRFVLGPDGRAVDARAYFDTAPLLAAMQGATA
jgi:hypothetical protein